MYAVSYPEHHERRIGAVCNSGTEIRCGSVMNTCILQERLHVYYITYSSLGDQYTCVVCACALLIFKPAVKDLCSCGTPVFVLFRFALIRKSFYV